MTTTNDTDPIHAEAMQCVARLKTLQSQLNVSDAQFVTRFRDARNTLLLGSERSWQRMKADDWTSLLVGKWISKLREATKQVDGGTPVDEVFKNLPFYSASTADMHLLEGQRNDRRCLPILATTGVGKTVWARAMVAERPASRIYIRANQAWRDRGFVHVRALAEALAMKETVQRKSWSQSLDIVTGHLRLQPRTIIFDEAHEGGTDIMRLIRHLIDSTDSRFVYLAYPTEWNRVTGANEGSISESKQFIGRCIKPVRDEWAAGPMDKDIRVYLERATELGTAAAKLVAKQMGAMVRENGGLRLLDDAIADAMMEAQADNHREVTTEDVVNAIRSCAGKGGPTQEEE